MLAKYSSSGDITKEGSPFGSCECVTIIETGAVRSQLFKNTKENPSREMTAL